VQPDVDHVQDGADQGDGVVQLDVPAAVVGEGGDPVARPHTQVPQHRHEAQHPVCQVGIADPRRLVGEGVDHLVGAVDGAHPLEDGGDGEGLVAHQALHQPS
jgi:hypothetical protein